MIEIPETECKRLGGHYECYLGSAQDRSNRTDDGVLDVAGYGVS